MIIDSDSETFLTQKLFRVLLQAMGHPGSIYNVSDIVTLSIKGFANPLLPILLKTLLDCEVGFSVIGKERENLKVKISELTRSSIRDISEADFIIISDGKSDGEILKAKRGSLEYPDKGATVIYVVDSLNKKRKGRPLAVLKGPGIKDKIEVFADGSMRSELSYLKEINSEFPRGVDSIFIDSLCNIMCIPRSSNIEVL
ncbi:MAG: phosphonate C-P lyase system protein PhnH [Thermodesulfovibrionales bacterium]|nr:phosphonate C-P lyase system protein PhnH [Thermodesulfovibrionales bacterium]